MINCSAIVLTYLTRMYPMIMSPIEANLQQIHREKDAAIAGLPVNLRQNITLVAVSKTKPAAMVREAFLAGQRDFGENYVQEGVAKVAELAALGLTTANGLVWHFIGPLQSNKAALAAQHFDWVHGVDRLKIAEALSRYRVPTTKTEPLYVGVQVNVSGEASKSGVAPHEVASLAAQVAVLPGLQLRGLMTIIENTTDIEVQRAQYREMRQIRLQLLRSGLLFDTLNRLNKLDNLNKFDTLSMGMSKDFKVAIEEGATMIRVGSAIFGARH